MSNRVKLQNVHVNDALVLYQLRKRFTRKDIEEVIGATDDVAHDYIQRLARINYVRWTKEKDESRAKIYRVTDRGLEIARLFGEELEKAK